MATLEQVKKWSAQATNGFNLDIRNLYLRNEKDLKKVVSLDETRSIVYTLSFREVYKHYSYSHLVIKLNKSVWTDSASGQGCSCMGMGHDVLASDKEYSKRNYKELCRVGAELPEDLEILFADGKGRDAGGGIILSSPIV